VNRDDAIRSLQSGELWDVLVIGGGATGLGTALDAAARGYRTALLEQHDFAKGTSSRSTKLIHGGVRYLRQGDVTLVRESLRERGYLLRNAPHLVHVQPFVVPAYGWWQKLFYGAGLKLYDLLSGDLSIGRSQFISRDETRHDLPTVRPDGLSGGVRYFDGQFDDARLAIALAQTVFDQGGVAVNYVPVLRLMKDNGRVCGVAARDAETGTEFEIRARVVVNATGVFSDAVRSLDESQAEPLLSVSQGAHIVLPRSFLPGQSALMVPKTADGRVLFAIPWHKRVLVGTTDIPVVGTPIEPRPFAEEIEFLRDHTGKYLGVTPDPGDILSAFAGLRPLVKSRAAGKTAQLSRSHTLIISRSGLVTITGGKWTTYRKMAEDTVDAAAKVADLPAGKSPTSELPLRKSDAVTENEAEKAIHAVRYEMARTVEDVLARRTRTLFLDAAAARRAAPHVAETMAAELGRDASWQTTQTEAFEQLAAGYLVK
jgi:glycerol-3-phosphate dehydrogenase